MKKLISLCILLLWSFSAAVAMEGGDEIAAPAGMRLVVSEKSLEEMTETEHAVHCASMLFTEDMHVRYKAFAIQEVGKILRAWRFPTVENAATFPEQWRINALTGLASIPLDDQKSIIAHTQPLVPYLESNQDIRGLFYVIKEIKEEERKELVDVAKILLQVPHASATDAIELLSKVPAPQRYFVAKHVNSLREISYELSILDRTFEAVLMIPFGRLEEIIAIIKPMLSKSSSIVDLKCLISSILSIEGKK